MREQLVLILALLVALAAVVAGVSLVFSPVVEIVRDDRPAATTPAAVEPPLLPTLPPPDRDGLGAVVRRGAQIMSDTAAALDLPGGRRPDCESCHFSGGRTTGGRNGGISLVGVASRYPALAADREQVVRLGDRINACLVQNVGAPPLAEASAELAALDVYLHWISRGVAQYQPVPWLGLQPLPIVPEAENVAGDPDVYRLRCAMCHGTDGQGTRIAPALWGEKSFAATSSMAATSRLAGFVALNMPKDNPILAPTEAIAAARFVLAQPRAERGLPGSQ